MQRGASLLELAVATAVLGLFLGAVLLSINMVKSATIRNFANSIEGINSKASTFQLKFSAIPGDMKSSLAAQNSFVPRAGTAGHGDGNEKIEGCDGALVLGCETTLFWRDLSDARMLMPALSAATDALVDGSVAGFSLDAYLLPAPFANNSKIFIYTLNGQNAFYTASFPSVSAEGVLTPSPALNPIQAEAVDDKLDDGSPISGKVRAMKDLTTYEDGGVANTPACLNTEATPPRYNSEGSYDGSTLCQLSLRAAF